MLGRTDENAFWRLIEDCRPGVPDPDARHLAALLTIRLTAGPLSVVTGFAERLSWALYRLDRSTRYSYESYSNAAGWAGS